MARTIADIYSEMIDEKSNYTVLSGLQPTIDSSQNLLTQLSSTSKVAIWRLIFFVVAVEIWIHEQLFDSHKAEVENIVANQRVGSIPWYIQQAKLFQYGDSLTYNSETFHYEYAVYDESKQIISQAAAIELNGNLVLKVAKDGTSSLEALSSAELALFESYINAIKFAGTKTMVISQSADDLNLTLNVVYDPLVLTSSGELIGSSGTYPVTVAINNYIQSLPFNGLFRVSDFIDSLKAVSGVIDVVPKTVEARFGTGSFQDVLATSKESYQSYSGYMETNTVSITYIEE